MAASRTEAEILFGCDAAPASGWHHLGRISIDGINTRWVPRASTTAGAATRNATPDWVIPDGGSHQSLCPRPSDKTLPAPLRPCVFDRPFFRLDLRQTGSVLELQDLIAE
jgi:hypothetical protein